MKSVKGLASIKLIRLTGLFYLFVIICAGFSQGYVRGTLVVHENAVETAHGILQNKGLFQLGLTTDLIAFLLDAVIAILLYKIFYPFNKTLAMLSSAFRLIAHPAIGSLNLLNHYMALKVLETDSLSNSFNTAQVQQISAYFMEAHHYGYLIAGSFFGIHCLLLAILIYRSNVFPKVFGGLFLGAAAGYLIESFGNFNVPGYEDYTALIVGITAALGEVGLTLYMLVKGTTESYKNLKKSPL
ncbi:MAG: DUF4386 domain-containing protein [Bacteroidota bacterium]|uniref:DUF4386 domain-containing protein n=1 Tax=Flagellimonas profundi TaxID=2915620 RepID=A0ABS3FAZ8_9FLAO|nr:DUF4386 domain-containing protein [Allomuricauda profundi]MBO0340335.1 DUF4386 domain-containing protein [Allomuricauda profundi]MEC7772349.1 DUF4386 domain-containing protein [Bacteroidota bacterium]